MSSVQARGVASLLLKTDTKEGVRTTSRRGRFTSRKKPWYSFNRKLGGFQRFSGLLWGRENLLQIAGFQPVDSRYTNYVIPVPKRV
jgi:hypothetical protein